MTRSSYRILSALRVAANYDLFPRFSAWVRALLYNPLGVLMLAGLAALLCGLFLHSQGFVLFGGVSAVVLLGLVWPWLSQRGLGGSISFERSRASEGEAVQVCLTLRNRLPWVAWGLVVRDGFSRANDDVAPAASIASAPRRRTVRCRWSFVPTCRGVYPLRVPRLATGFPFGLWENSRPITVETRLLVWPRTYPVGPVPLVGGDQLVEGNVSRNKVGSNGDVLGVRPYRRGDSPRRIHWGQSARHDRLIVRELQSNARPVIQLVLDADQRVHVGDGPDDSREWAVRIVASLAKGWLHSGAQVGAVWNEQVIPPASGQQQLHRLLDGLARLPDDTPGQSLAQLLTNPVCRNFRDGLQVIVTTDATAASEGRAATRDDRQRWVIPETTAFRDPSGGRQPPESHESRGASAPRSGRCPWLWIDSVERIPALLRGGWKEARHGT
jgi:uncharacterized protein (DUF58 family)